MLRSFFFHFDVVRHQLNPPLKLKMKLFPMVTKSEEILKVVCDHFEMIQISSYKELLHPLNIMDPEYVLMSNTEYHDINRNTEYHDINGNDFAPLCNPATILETAVNETERKLADFMQAYETFAKEFDDFFDQ